VKSLNIEHRTLNIEHRRMSTLRFIDINLNGTAAYGEPLDPELKGERQAESNFSGWMHFARSLINR